MYATYFKRPLDFMVSAVALILLSPILLLLIVIGAIVLKGNPFFFQPRPGMMDKSGQERIFYLVKFRTMSNAVDENGNLLPDEQRLGRYGTFLRSTSLDELPSLWNILKGELSLVGPRPQLVRDMTFMTPEQRQRHTVRPGLTGWAQVNGYRGDTSIEERIRHDIFYIENWSPLLDIRILLMTVFKVFNSEKLV